MTAPLTATETENASLATATASQASLVQIAHEVGLCNWNKKEGHNWFLNELLVILKSGKQGGILALGPLYQAKMLVSAVSKWPFNVIFPATEQVAAEMTVGWDIKLQFKS